MLMVASMAGGADDGYAVFTALATVKALKDHGQLHGRIVILIECSEESGSRDLPHYIDTYAARLGTPSLVICLDLAWQLRAALEHHEFTWANASICASRCCAKECILFGLSGGVPNPFMVLRQLLDRLEDADTGAIRLSELHVPIPEERIQQAESRRGPGRGHCG